MKFIGRLLLFILLIISGVWIYRWYQANQQRKKELEEEWVRQRELERQQLFDLFKARLDSVNTANNNFKRHLDLKTGYFTHYQMISWKNQNANLFDEVKGKPFETIRLLEEEVRSIASFINNFNNSERSRDEFNKSFVNEELKTYSDFFDRIEGRKLDGQQRTAVVIDDDNSIVIAGAGSGKTTTIVGKVNYVIDRYNVDPKEILLISFTNKSASTLAERINIPGVEAKTFHKFGKDIIVETEERQPSIFDEKQFNPLLKSFFTQLITTENYLHKVINYFTDFLKPRKSQSDFDNQGDYIQYIKDKNFRTYNVIEVQGRGGLTYNMEVVKSIEECKIANFLLFNGLNYKYEYPYEHKTADERYRQYKPDFTIIQGDKRICIEHFGISRCGNVPAWFKGDDTRSASEKYRDDMNGKRETHKTNGTILIETYSYEMNEDILFTNLKENLTLAGISLKPKSPEEIWDIIKNAAKEEVDSFVLLFGTFINLMKSNNYSLGDVINKNNKTPDKFLKKRNTLFVEIIKPIVERYENYLKERNEIDFSDMINKASEYIASGKHKRKFSYVIIDEFQDISIGRYQLVKAIKQSNPSCKLFCVGDDWQSIYRFSGSDIALFKEFEKYFGFTVKSKIETTYRFHDPLIKLSSDFIQKNPDQAKKELKSISATKNTQYKIHYSITDSQDDSNAVRVIFDQLINIYKDIEGKEIFILGRYGFDIKRIKNEESLFRIDKPNETIYYSIRTREGQTRQLKAQFMTVHKAKVLEADIIVILNCNSGKYGFPSEMSEDQVLNLLLSESDQFENGEERRLFYVAMTRAKEIVYFIADSSFKSKFILELELESGQSPNKKCPSCKTADIVLRRSGTAKNGNAYKFYGCSNYLYGCEYTATEWINN